MMVNHRGRNSLSSNKYESEIQTVTDLEIEDKLPLVSNADYRGSPIDHDIAWCNVNFKLGNKVILNNVYGKVNAGEVCAIMGPSGAGKSSLLNVLAGRSATNMKAKVTGVVTVAGKRIDPVDFRQRIAYVMQEDAHMKTVTPREALEFSARLRLPDTTSDYDIKALVNRTLIELGLEKCADTMCGGGLIKGISGGEKKRTSVGVEIVTNPDLLFLDEPTSGLDSFTAYSIIELLTKIANRGCAVLCTIHQPSSELFDLFNSVILLKEGTVIYQGPISNMTQYFSKFQYNCPNHYNPADYMMWITQKESLDQFSKSGLLGANEKGAEEIRQLTSKCYENQEGHFPVMVRATFLKQLYYLTEREILKVKRDKGALIAKFGITIFLNLLYGLIFMSAGGKGDADPDNMNAHFGVIMMVAISNMFGAAQPIMLNLPIERPMFLREYSTGTYGALSYFTSKTAVELPMNLLTTVIQFLIIYNMCSFSGNFTYIVLASFALASASCSVAIVLGSLVDDVKSASELQPLLFTPQLLFAGFFIRTEFIPNFLRWSQYLCSLKYAISLILLTEFDSSNKNCQGSAASEACRAVLTRNGIHTDQWWLYALVLFSLFLGFRVIAAIVMVKRANNSY